MGMSMQLCQSMSLDMRQSLLSKLTIHIVQEIRLKLELYLEREEKFTALFQKALECGMVRMYDKHGMKFEVALINENDVPEEAKELGMTFSHCLFNGFEAMLFGEKHAMQEGSWLLFVVIDKYPDTPDYVLDYAAVHERGEQATVGDHNLATKLEFAVAKAERKLLNYTKWIESNNPQKLADAFSYREHLQLPDDDDFARDLKYSEEATHIRELIEEFEWPIHVLKKISQYKNKSTEIAGIITSVFALAKGQIHIVDLDMIDMMIMNVRRELERGLRLIEPNRQYVNLAVHNELWSSLREELSTEFGQTMHRMREVFDQIEVVKKMEGLGLNNELPNDGALSFSFEKAIARH